MSKIALSGNASGTGTFTFASPNSNTDRTLDLPDATTTLVGTDATQTLTNKSIVATQLTGTIAAARLPAGSVLQVVMGTYSTQTCTSSTSYVDTGLSATITPSSASSKVLVFANVPDAHNNATGAVLFLNIVRASTQIIEFVKHGDYIQSNESLVTYGGSTSYLDSPNTTSATTYKIQFKVQSGSQCVFLNNSTGTIILMEIAA